MARAFGRILSRIWDDPDFLALDEGEQRMYLFLLSQRNLNHAGLIPVTLRRWSQKARSLTPDRIVQHLAELERARFVVLDYDTEELLVRTLVINDDVYKQPRVMGAMVSGAREIASPRLRWMLLAEVDRIPLAELSDEPGKNGAASIRAQVAGHITDLKAAFASMPTPPEPPRQAPIQGDREGVGEPLPEGVAHGVGEGYPQASTRVGASPQARALPLPLPLPLPVSPAPSPVPPTAGRRAPRAGAPLRAVPDEPTAQVILGEYLERCTKRPPGTVIGQIGKQVKAMLAEDIDPDDIRRGIAAWMAKGLHPSTLPSVVNEVMNTRPTAIGAPSVAAAVQPAPIHAYQADLEAHAALAGQPAAAGAYEEFDGLTTLQRLGVK